MILFGILIMAFTVAVACCGGAGCLLPLLVFIVIGIFLQFGAWWGFAFLAGAFLAFLIAVYFKT